VRSSTSNSTNCIATRHRVVGGECPQLGGRQGSLSIGQEDTEERDVANLPTFLVSDAATAEALIATNGWPGPDTMADQFIPVWVSVRLP
jgi:hypothetical protein